MEYPVYNLKGENVGAMELPQDIFGVKLNPDLLHQVVVSLQSSARHPIAHTKTRGEVRGGGKKPWKQKGTGRARVGSIRSPLWRGGGKTFAVKSSFKQLMPGKMHRKAINMLISLKIKNHELIVLNNLKPTEIKTKTFYQILKNFKTNDKKNLILISKPDTNLTKSAQNIKDLKLGKINQLQAIDLMNFKTTILDKESFENLGKISKERQ